YFTFCHLHFWFCVDIADSFKPWGHAQTNSSVVKPSGRVNCRKIGSRGGAPVKIFSSVASMLVFSVVASAQGIDCGGLLKIDSSRLPTPNTVLSSATPNAARPAQGNVPALPEHCEIMGRINERTGANGQQYAIKFHLRLPS